MKCSVLRMGADDYIRKPFSQRLLIERIRALLRRKELAQATASGAPTTAEPPINRGDLVLDPSRHVCTWKGNEVNLTVTEFLLLKALALRPGLVKSRDNLMDAAYGEHVYVDDRTIDSHVKRLRKKFKTLDDDFAHIETLYGLGYRYPRELVRSGGPYRDLTADVTAASPSGNPPRRTSVAGAFRC